MKQPLKSGKQKKKNTSKYACNGKKLANKVAFNPVYRYGNGKKYGTSKLEHDFAVEYLDKLGLKYIYQFEAKDIKRFYDFAVVVYDNYPYKYEIKDGIRSIIQEGKEFTVGFLIEVDGDYFHSNPSFIKQKDMNPMQKHNKYVDKLKDEWAKERGMLLLRIWENDIRHDRGKVVKLINSFMNEAKKRRLIVENRRKPH